MVKLGQMNVMTVVRDAPQGLYLNAGPERDAILLPTRWVTPEIGIGSRVEVFIYKDSEGRPIATTDQPKVQVGQCANLEVVNVIERVGVFLDWGLSKDLLLPFRDLGRRDEIDVGDRLIVAVYVDSSERIASTMRLDDYFATDRPSLKEGAEVDVLIWGESPLGYKAVVNQSYSGLLYRSETPGDLNIGDQIIAYVKHVYDDGKIDLRRDPSGYSRVEQLSETILRKLDAAGGRMKVNDKSSPEVIRARFDTSKKAFKQALGSLYKQRLIRFTDEGIERTNPNKDRA